MASDPDDGRKVHGTSRIDPVEGETKKTNWLPWILGLLALLGLLFALSRWNRDEPREAAPVEVNTINTADEATTNLP